MLDTAQDGITTRTHDHILQAKIDHIFLRKYEVPAKGR